MHEESLALPPELGEAHAVGFDYRNGDGVDYEPYGAFLSGDETARWWRAWTGNQAVSGSDFRVFGQDGTGGMAAFWLIRPWEPIRQQPVAFLGSEGEVAVIARDLGAYLWLLAGGFGPLEATMFPKHEHHPRADVRLAQIAQRYAPSGRQEPAEIIAAAAAEFPDFQALVDSVCR